MGDPTDFGIEFLKEMMNIAAASSANTLSMLLGEPVHVDLPEVILSPTAESIRPAHPGESPHAWHITWMSGPLLAATISIADSRSEEALAKMLPPLIDSQERSVGELTDDVLQRENDESGGGDFHLLWDRLHSHAELTPEKSVAARSRLSWQGGEIHMIIFIKPSSALEMLAGTAIERALRD